MAQNSCSNGSLWQREPSLEQLVPLVLACLALLAAVDVLLRHILALIHRSLLMSLHSLGDRFGSQTLSPSLLPLPNYLWVYCHRVT